MLPCVRGLRIQLNELSENYKCKMVQTLKSSLEKRLTVFESKHMYQMAAALDPRFTLDWCFTDFEKQSNTSSLIHLGKSVNLQNFASGSNPESSSQSPPKKRSKLFSFMSSTREKARSELSLEKEVKDYFADATVDEEKDPLQYWKIK